VSALIHPDLRHDAVKTIERAEAELEKARLELLAADTEGELYAVYETLVRAEEAIDRAQRVVDDAGPTE
jgi:hypothetical protein